jgi:hypothetical protein
MSPVNLSQVEQKSHINLGHMWVYVVVKKYQHVRVDKLV